MIAVVVVAVVVAFTIPGADACAFVRAHPVLAILGFCALVGLAWKRIPEARRLEHERRFPRLVGLVRLCYEIGIHVPGAWLTLRHQIIGGVPKDEARQQRRASVAPTNSRSGSGFVRPPAMVVMLILALVAIALLASLDGCSQSAVQRQAAAAHVSAQALNRALPVVVRAYEDEGRSAIMRVCCERVAMVEALEAHDRRWGPVQTAWQFAHVAHGAWRLELERCRSAPADAGAGCAVNVAQLGAVFILALEHARCALWDVGRPDLDPVPGTPTCVRDGGAS